METSTRLKWPGQHSCQRPQSLSLHLSASCGPSLPWLLQLCGAARDNSSKPKRFILSQLRRPNPFSLWPNGRQDYCFKNHIQTQQHSHVFGCQHSDLQDRSKAALNIPTDTIVLYWSTAQSNALRNRLILPSIRLQVWQNIKEHLQKTKHSSLISVYPATASPLWPFRPRSGNKKLKIRALRNRIFFFPSLFYWKTINIGWTPLDVLCPEPLNTKCWSSCASKRIFCHKMSFRKASSLSDCCQESCKKSPKNPRPWSHCFIILWQILLLHKPVLIRQKFMIALNTTGQ